MSDRSDHEGALARVLESNERRLDALDRRGVQVAVDGRTVLQFLLDRTLSSPTPRAFRLNWGLNVAGLLKHAEAGCTPASRHLQAIAD